jgi:CheY-like chemotaxis protein
VLLTSDLASTVAVCKTRERILTPVDLRAGACVIERRRGDRRTESTLNDCAAPNSEVELPARGHGLIETAWHSEEHMANAAERPVIMVLESDVIVRTEIAEFLRECGYKVIEGITANDLWIIIDAKVKLDVVFSEVNLSGETDGFTVARRIRQTNPEIDIILTSSVERAAEKSKDLCEEGPLKKPYRTQDVAARIHLLLERRRSAIRKPK